MFLARQPDGAQVQVYDIPHDRATVISDDGRIVARQAHARRSWRYTGGRLLRSSGVAATDVTAEAAVNRLKLLLIAEKYGD